jgi:hypothetical protein
MNFRRLFVCSTLPAKSAFAIKLSGDMVSLRRKIETTQLQTYQFKSAFGVVNTCVVHCATSAPAQLTTNLNVASGRKQCNFARKRNHGEKCAATREVDFELSQSLVCFGVRVCFCLRGRSLLLGHPISRNGTHKAYRPSVVAAYTNDARCLQMPTGES